MADILGTIDPVTLAIGVVIGVAAALAASYIVFYSKPRQPKVEVFQRDRKGELSSKTVTVHELEQSRKETRTLMLERDLLSSALTRIYEAETEGKITRDEREMIARRYSEQIRDLESKLRDKELVIEVGELEKLRDELMTLFREKVQNIEARLDQAKERLQPKQPAVPARREAPRRQAAATQQEDDLEKVVERREPKSNESEGEKRVRELRDEVMDALTKLEEIDTKENESP